jgi:FkbM family methyltransferase
VLPVTRRFEFPGKRRLRRLVPLPEDGIRDVDLVGARFRLDLAESLHRDYYFGLCDQLELRLVSRLLERGGDFVDVGAHVGLYTVSAARALRGRGRVLAFEPNPSARVRLEENVALNACSNVVVDSAAVADEAGYATLHVPREGDTSWSTLDEARVADSAFVDVETTTLDAEVERRALRPAVVKIDVEGCEVEVVRGARRVLRRRPALLIELVDQNAGRVISALSRLGYAVARAGTRHLEPWPADAGASNAVFLQPRHLQRLRPRERRAFARGDEHVIGEVGPARGQTVEEARDRGRRAGEGRDWAQALARDTDDLEAGFLDELDEESRREDPHVPEVGSVVEPVLERIGIPPDQ